MLPFWSIAAYSLPAIVLGLTARLVVLYAMKFSTDVLLVAPFIIGLIFGLSRIWDAVTDPLVGYLSDKTEWQFGRRRSWLLIGAIPFGLLYAMVFAVPASLGEVGTVLWLVVAIVGFYTAMTVVAIPHLSWGAELSQSAEGRSRLFGGRHVAEIIGGLGALGIMALFIQAEKESLDHARLYVGEMSVAIGAFAAILIAAGVLTLSERRVKAEARPRGGLYTAAKDVWVNPHARLVLIVMLIEFIGAATMGATALYVAQYVMGAPEIAPVIITIYLIIQIAMVPVAVKAISWVPKHKLWLYSMAGTGAAFGGMFLLAFIESQQLQIAWNIAMVVFAAIAAAVGGVVGPTVLSDIIDFDEYTTGERKEGAYFAVWNFAGKAAGGVTIMLVGVVLSVIGFVPNVEQTQFVKVGLAGLLGLFPLICYWIGAWVFSHYKLDDETCRTMRIELDTRKSA